MSTFNLGRILPMFKGTWSSSTNYNQLDIVYYNGSSYVAKNSVTSGGNNPSINNNWQIVAMKGELSPTLSPEQEASIINAIMSQGVVIDPDYTHTDNNFTNNYLNTIDNINFGTLTVKRNNTDVGTFTANQNGTININVPTNSSDLNDSSTLQRIEDIITNSSLNITLQVKANTCYVFDSIDNLDILSFDSIDISDKTTWNVPQSEIYFKVNNSFTFNYPSGTYFVNSSLPTWVAGDEYQMIIKGGVIQINQIKQL